MQLIIALSVLVTQPWTVVKQHLLLYNGHTVSDCSNTNEDIFVITESK